MVHRILREAISDLQDLAPGASASQEARRYELLVLHYVEGLDSVAVADRLGISRRQFYRERSAALDALAELLWDRHFAHAEERLSEEPPTGESDQAAARRDLLWREAARTIVPRETASISSVVEGACSILSELMQHRHLAVRIALAPDLPRAATDPGLARQLVVACLGYLCNDSYRALIRVRAELAQGAVRLSLIVEPATAVHHAPPSQTRQRMAILEEIAELGGVRVVPVPDDCYPSGFELHFPTSARPTVLVVDDNPDIQQLFRRYLNLRYSVVTAASAAEALAVARSVPLHAITVDLMMPHQDGWMLLQALRSHAQTHSIPVVVCSVLRQKELAMALGASAFLEKPVSAQSLLAALETLGPA
jgi:CheY-like chemotaxis protein